MTLQQALKEVYMTYCAAQSGGNSKQYEAAYKLYNTQFGGGNQLINGCLMAFELNMNNEVTKVLREALVKLNSGEEPTTESPERN